MFISMAQTKTTNLVQVEVMAPIISATLKDKLRFAAFADIDNSLKGQPGDTLSFPAYKYSGDAQVVAEGAEIPIDTLEAGKKSVTVRKIAKGLEITDEAQMSSLGDPLGEAGKQIGLALANGEDNAILEALKGATLKFEGTPDSIDSINTAIELFNDEDYEPMVLFVNPLDASALRKAAAGNWTRATDLGDDVVVKGAFGELLGAIVVRTRKVAKGEAFLAKKGAVKLVTKRAPLIETERYASRKATGLFGDEHFAAYLYDESKAIKIGAPAGA